jgi:hypothetical protein
MNQAIISYHQDEENDWVARLTCGHAQHVRHNPPFMNRPWVISVSGRHKMLGYSLPCMKCDLGLEKDD